MATRDRNPRRGLGHESPGSIDYPFDTDPQNPNATASDVTCTVPWRADGYEAIAVFVDPALRDRADELCAVVSGWAGAHADIDTLSDAIRSFSEREDVSASIFEDPRDALSTGLVAVAFTLG